MYLVNKTARVIIASGGIRLIPEIPCPVSMKEEELSTLGLSALISTGAIKVLDNETQAKEQEESLSDKTLSELKAYAKKNNINLGDAKSKEAILVAIEKSRS